MLTANLPPDFIRPDSTDTNTCIAFEWHGDRTFTSKGEVVTHVFRVVFQRRWGGHNLLGWIRLSADGWVIDKIGKQALPQGESLTYETWQGASDELYSRYTEGKRAQVKATLEA